MNFVKRVRAELVLATDEGTADRTSAIVDTRGSHGACFVLHFGAVTGGDKVKLQGGHLPDGSDMADLEGTGWEYASTDANAAFAMEIGHSRYRYLRLAILKGGNQSEESAICYLHGNQTKPVDQPSDVFADHFHAPAQGTA